MRRRFDVKEKPAFGAVPDLGHRLCPNVAAFLFTEQAGAPRNILSPAILKPNAAPNLIWTPKGASFNGSTTYADYDATGVAPTTLTAVARFTTGASIPGDMDIFNTTNDSMHIRVFTTFLSGEVKTTGTWYAAAASTVPAPNTTYTCVLQFDPVANQVSFYLDGIRPDAPTTSTGTLLTAGTNFYFGRNAANGNLFIGTIECVSFYNWLLTPADIAWIQAEPYSWLRSARVSAKLAPARVTGTGSVVVDAPAVAGTARERITGAIAVALTHPALTVAGREQLAATGSVVFAHPSINVTSRDHGVGTVTVALAHPAVAAAGTLRVTGTATESLAHPAITVVGRERVVATGTALFVHPALSSAGKERITSTSAITVGHPLLAAAGANSSRVAGTSAIALAHPLLTLVGRERLTSTATIAFAHPTFSGIGEGAHVSGIGTVAFAHPLLSATGGGVAPVSGTAYILFAHPAMAVVGRERETGSAAVSVASTALLAAGVQRLIATGVVAIAPPSLTAAGREKITGTGTESIAHPSLLAQGRDISMGTAAVLFSGSNFSAIAHQTATGTIGLLFKIPGIGSVGAVGAALPHPAAVQFAAPAISGVGVRRIAGDAAVTIHAPHISGSPFVAAGVVGKCTLRDTPTGMITLSDGPVGLAQVRDFFSELTFS